MQPSACFAMKNANTSTSANNQWAPSNFFTHCTTTLWMLAAILIFALACTMPDDNGTEQNKNNANHNADWWKNEIIYQIYTRSFKDSDGDGVGDLKGIIEKLDYIKDLGVTAVWLNPIYKSPNDDNGYDVSDYEAIQPEFGTMQDFDNLLQGMHQRGLKLIMDIVVNHSSDEHPWFVQSRSSRNNPYRNYYHWWPAEKGKPPFRYSLFDEQHNAWKYDSLTNSYYLHYFSVKQPDLNWENPALRQEIYKMMRFWADKGVDGFRLDAFQFAAKDTTWPALPNGYEKEFAKYVAMRPGLHNYLQEMHKEVFSKYKLLTVAEGAGNTFADAHMLVDADRKELNMAYSFAWIDLAKSSGFPIATFKKTIAQWDSAFAQQGWISIFMANHDNARMVSRFASDSPQYRAIAANMLNTFLLTMRGTPYCYYGDELGMTNPRYNTIEQYNDVSTLNEYKYQLGKGKKPAELLKEFMFSSRDNGRSPMQWDSSANAGFTTGTPWLGLHPNYRFLNVAAQLADTSSCLRYFKRLTNLRKSNPVFVHGTFTMLDMENNSVMAYTRTLEKDSILVLLNMTGTNATFNLPFTLNAKPILLTNYNQTRSPQILKPFEARVIKL